MTASTQKNAQCLMKEGSTSEHMFAFLFVHWGYRWAWQRLIVCYTAALSRVGCASVRDVALPRVYRFWVYNSVFTGCSVMG